MYAWELEGLETSNLSRRGALWAAWSVSVSLVELFFPRVQNFQYTSDRIVTFLLTLFTPFQSRLLNTIPVKVIVIILIAKPILAFSSLYLSNCKCSSQCGIIYDIWRSNIRDFITFVRLQARDLHFKQWVACQHNPGSFLANYKPSSL